MKLEIFLKHKYLPGGRLNQGKENQMKVAHTNVEETTIICQSCGSIWEENNSICCKECGGKLEAIPSEDVLDFILFHS